MQGRCLWCTSFTHCIKKIRTETLPEILTWAEDFKEFMYTKVQNYDLVITSFM